MSTLPPRPSDSKYVRAEVTDGAHGSQSASEAPASVARTVASSTASSGVVWLRYAPRTPIVNAGKGSTRR